MATEKRLIDANAMHKFVEDKVAEGKDGWANGVPYEWAYALTAVDLQPTVDAVEVVHGRWEMHGDDDDLSCSYFCSQCGYNMDESEYLDNFSHFRYCPNCGAKMDGDGNEP